MCDNPLKQIEEWGQLLEGIRSGRRSRLKIGEIIDIRRLVYFYVRIYTLLQNYNIKLKDASVVNILKAKPLQLEDGSYASIDNLYQNVYLETMEAKFRLDNDNLLEIFNLALKAKKTKSSSFRSKGSPGWAGLKDMPLRTWDGVTCNEAGIDDLENTKVILHNNSILMLITSKPRTTDLFLTAINLDGLVYNVLNDDGWVMGTGSNESPSIYTFTRIRKAGVTIPKGTIFKQCAITHCLVDVKQFYDESIMVMSTSKTVNQRSWLQLKRNIQGYTNANPKRI